MKLKTWSEMGAEEKEAILERLEEIACEEQAEESADILRELDEGC